MTPLLACRGVTRRFGGLTALDRVDLEVREGEVLGVIGPNGAGKTTLFDVVSGALAPSEGEVLLRGRPVAGLPPGRLCRLGVARTHQLVRPFGSLTALDNVLVGLCYGRRDRVPRRRRPAEAVALLELVGLEDRAGLRAEHLTLVERKHLEIARALATDPVLLLLDEVVAGLSPTEVRRTVETLGRVRARGVNLVLIEHVLRVVRGLCGRVAVLDHGRKIAEGPPEEVLRDPAVVEAYLGRAPGAGEGPDA